YLSPFSWGPLFFQGVQGALRLREIRLQTQGIFEKRGGLGRAALPGEDARQVVANVGVIRGGGHTGAVLLDGLVRPPLRQKQVAEVVARFHETGPRAQRRLVACLRLGGAAETLEGLGGTEQAVRVVRHPAQDGFVFAQRFRGLSRLQQGEGQVAPRERVGRLEAQRLAVVGDRLVRAARLKKRQAEV